jgi:hypothetical protein
MKLGFAFICDYAEASPNGKINALGIGFSNITAHTIPFKHSHFCLVVQVFVSPVEAGKKNVRIALIDEDGNDVIPNIQPTIDVPRPQGRREAVGQFVVELANIEFKKYGAYSIHIAIDGNEIADVSFNVVPPQA